MVVLRSREVNQWRITRRARSPTSTLRTSLRDWFDIWVTPHEDNLELPLDDWLNVDLNGSSTARRSSGRR